MRPGLVVFVLSILVFVTVIFGTINLVSVKRFERQKEEAERIFRQRFFGDNEKTKKELGEFFHKTKRLIFTSALSFASAFFLVIVVVKRLWPSDSILKTIISLSILLVIFGLPITWLTLVGKQTSDLEDDIMKKFNTQ